MSDIPKVMKGIMAALGGLSGYLFPGLAGPLYMLMVLLVLDYITGMLKATVTKTLSSRIGSKGIVKKVFMLVIIVVSSMIDVSLNLNATMVTMTLFFYIANEALSILENAVEIGVPVPEKLKELLLQVREEEEVEELNLDKLIEERSEE